MSNLYLCAEMLVELAKREKQAGIFPEKDVDIFMKVIKGVMLIYTLIKNVVQPRKTSPPPLCSIARRFLNPLAEVFLCIFFTASITPSY